MPKRQTATEKWSDSWFMKLTPVQKLAWLYLLDSCDCCGVWDRNDMLANVMIGTQVNWDEALTAFGDRRVCALPNGKWFVMGFIEFQYGSDLSVESRVHQSVYSRMMEHELFTVPTLGEALLKAWPREIEERIKKKEERKGCGETKFQRPTIEELKLLGAKAGLPESEVFKFFNFYESKGWKVGKVSMKSVTHALANWRLTWQERQRNTNFARKGQPI